MNASTRKSRRSPYARHPPVPLDATGPAGDGQAFRDSSAALGLPAEHLLLLLQAVEGKLIQGLAPLHEMVNQHLVAAGILPRLRRKLPALRKMSPPSISQL